MLNSVSLLTFSFILKSERLKQAFTALDADKDGFVTADEIAAFFKTKGMFLSLAISFSFLLLSFAFFSMPPLYLFFFSVP